MSKIYDVVILGAGPAGLAAGLYAGRARMSVLIVEKGKDGGQIAITDEIENYPGQIVEGESGPSLIARMTEQCEKFGVERVTDVINDVVLEGDVKKLISAKGEYCGKTLIIATGAFARPIGCKGEKEFMGKGVSYCATCDANFFEDFEVYVVGGGDSAVEEAMYLTKFARKVTIIHRRDELIGTLPSTKIFEGKGLELDERGYIPTDDNMKTNIPGVFAAGDVRVKSLRQVVTAAADGAIATTQCEKYINEME